MTCWKLPDLDEMKKNARWYLGIYFWAGFHESSSPDAARFSLRHEKSVTMSFHPGKIEKASKHVSLEGFYPKSLDICWTTRAETYRIHDGRREWVL